jgi:hypothetical protein
VTRYEVVFTPEAEEQLAELYRYIEENATAAVALSLRARSSNIAKDWQPFRCVGHRAMTCGPAFGLQRTSGVRRSPIPSMMREFRSLVFFTVVETTRPRYNLTSQRIETKAIRGLKPTVTGDGGRMRQPQRLRKGYPHPLSFVLFWNYCVRAGV